jgi:hypothetical protein
MATDLLAEELSLRFHRSREAPRYWSARSATGPSVIRVFVAGTRPALLNTLVRLPVEEIPRLRTKQEFEGWFELQLGKIGRTLQKENEDNHRVQPGLVWGHGAKVLAIYLRSLVLHSRYFPDRIVNRVRSWLFIPVDSYVIKRLKRCRVPPPFSKIREIATRRDFYFVQDLLAERCAPGVPRVVFDDSWADREEANSRPA